MQGESIRLGKAQLPRKEGRKPAASICLIRCHRELLWLWITDQSFTTVMVFRCLELSGAGAATHGACAWWHQLFQGTGMVLVGKTRILHPQTTAWAREMKAAGREEVKRGLDGIAAPTKDHRIIESQDQPGWKRYSRSSSPTVL